MSVAVWPTTLQQILNANGFGIEFPVAYIESETEFGPKKRRRRTTQSFERLSCSINLEKDEYLTFKNFYDVTLNGGVLPFMFLHPITQVPTNYRLGGLKIQPISGTYFSVDMSWEQVG